MKISNQRAEVAENPQTIDSDDLKIKVSDFIATELGMPRNPRWYHDIVVLERRFLRSGAFSYRN